MERVRGQGGVRPGGAAGASLPAPWKLRNMPTSPMAPRLWRRVLLRHRLLGLFFVFAAVLWSAVRNGSHTDGHQAQQVLIGGGINGGSDDGSGSRPVEAQVMDDAPPGRFSPLIVLCGRVRPTAWLIAPVVGRCRWRAGSPRVCLLSRRPGGGMHRTTSAKPWRTTTRSSTLSSCWQPCVSATAVHTGLPPLLLGRAALPGLRRDGHAESPLPPRPPLRQTSRCC